MQNEGRGGKRHTDLGQVTVVVPTRNEALNIEPLLARLLPLGPREVLFVDDSDDNTPQIISSYPDPRVRCLHRRPGERSGGLGGAVLAGFLSAETTFVAVIDGDLQHPPETLTDLLAAAEAAEHPDLVVASRYREGGSNAGLGRQHRLLLSTFGTWLVRKLRPAELRGVSDPLSGCFLLRRDRVNFEDLHPDGFKILLETLLTFPWLTRTEVSYHFATRHLGHSNANIRELYRLLRTTLRRRYLSGSS